MLERHDAPLRSRLRLAPVHHLGLRIDRVAMEDGLRKLQLLEAEVADGRAECRLAHRQAHDDAEREDAVHERLAELCLRRGVKVHVQRLRVHRETREQDVVRLRHGASRLVLERHAYRQLFVVLAGHRHPPCRAVVYANRSIPRRRSVAMMAAWLTWALSRTRTGCCGPKR